MAVDPWKDFVVQPAAPQPQPDGALASGAEPSEVWGGGDPWRDFAPKPPARPALEDQPPAPPPTFGAELPSYDPKTAPQQDLKSLITGQDMWSKPPPFTWTVDDGRYQKAAEEDRKKLDDANTPTFFSDRNRLFLQGASLNTADEIIAAGMTPFNMARYGTTNPFEGYNYGKAAQDLELAKARERWGSGATEFIGGLTGVGLPATAVTKVASPIINYGRGVLTGAGIGTIGGFAGGNTPDERVSGATMGGIIGGGVGAVLPPLVAAAKYIARPFAPLFRNPDKQAVEQVAKVQRDSGRTFPEVEQDVSNAQAAGQSEYRLADALGIEGQRKLTAQAKQPGPQREDITKLITDRNENMPYRVRNEKDRALDTPISAKAATENLITTAKTKASPVYREAEDVPTWSDKLQEFYDSKEGRQGIASGVDVQRTNNVGTGVPFNPTDAMITGFDKAGDPIITGVPNMKTVNTLKTGLDKMIGSNENINPGTGQPNEKGAALIGLKNRLLAEVDAINPKYAEARRIYRDPMQVKDAVETGRDMAKGGRYEDTLKTFREAPPTEQQGQRIGYSDELSRHLEEGRFPARMKGNNVKGVNELSDLSLYQGPRLPADPALRNTPYNPDLPIRNQPQLQPDQLRQFLNREETMMRTGVQAKGGPATAENLADIGAQDEAAGSHAAAAFSHALQGNVPGTTRSILNWIGSRATGDSEGLRNSITKMLMLNKPEDISALAERIKNYDLARRGYNPWTGRARIPEGQ